MDVRKLSCIVAAGFIGTMVVSAATSSPVYAKAKSEKPLVIVGERVDPALQRRVSYRDLNLVFPAAQTELRKRISHTAADLCYDLNDGSDPDRECYNFAVRGTRPQVADAIARAKLRMAGKPVGPDLAIAMVITSH